MILSPYALLRPRRVGGASAVAGTTWNPADKSANVTLSNGNLTATYASGSGDSGARSISSKSSGKSVFEGSFATPGGTLSDTGFGIALASATFPGLGSLGTNGWMMFQSGNVYNGSLAFAGTGWGVTTASVFMVAVDFTNLKVWFKHSLSANWNNDVLANQNPATNTGGLAITGPVFGACVINSASVGQAWTANFGGPFTNAVPSGFAAWGI